MKTNQTTKTVVALLVAVLLAPTLARTKTMAVPPEKTERPIDLVICLDTSGSMLGLIEAAKQKLWDIVNQLAKADPKPRLRVGLYVYGTPGYGAESGYVKKLIDLTDDLDAIYAQLTPLRTDGGDEYVARVVRAATLEQSWSDDKNALKIIVVAGNEPATQDRQFTIQDVCKEAITRGIIVNSIYCGSPTRSEAEGWREVARLADGQFASIDHHNGTVVVTTPFDQKLAELSSELNTTYIAYGARAKEGLAKQQAADASSSALNIAAAAERAAAKASGLYQNARWDLVDASKERDFDLKNLKKEDLPDELKEKTVEEQKAHLESMAKRRAEIQNEINTLNLQRRDYIEAEMKKAGKATDKTFDAAMLRALREQAEKKGFQFEPSK